MQFSKIFAILSLTATSLAVPTVELQKRTGPSPAACAQAQGSLQCCTEKPTLAPTSSLGIPSSGGVLGIITSLLPQFVPVINADVECNPILAVAIQSCNAVNVCCITPSSYNTLSPQQQSSVIPILSNNNILSNNQIAFCPSVNV